MPNTYTVKINTSRLKTNPRGLNSITDIYSQMLGVENSNIEIDCSDLQWIDAHLAAPLLIIIWKSYKLGNTVQLKGLKDSVKKILQKNGMLQTTAKDTYDTTIALTSFRLDQEVEFAQYTRKALDKKRMPRMSASLENKFFESIDELFSNCALHSNSDTNVIACGQFFPKLEELSFCISDGGRGVDGSLASAGITFDKASEAINWAMQSNNTSRHGDIPGGLGSQLLREFVAINGGKMLILSNGGYWCQEASNVSMTEISQPFPGTTVILSINTADKNSYTFGGNASPLDIW